MESEEEDDWDEDDDSDVAGSEGEGPEDEEYEASVEDDDDDAATDGARKRRPRDQNTRNDSMNVSLSAQQFNIASPLQHDASRATPRRSPTGQSPSTIDADLSIISIGAARLGGESSSHSVVSDDEEFASTSLLQDQEELERSRLIHQSPSKRVMPASRDLASSFDASESNDSILGMIDSATLPIAISAARRQRNDSVNEDDFVEANSRPASLLGQSDIPIDDVATRSTKVRDTRGLDGRPRFEVVIKDAA